MAATYPLPTPDERRAGFRVIAESEPFMMLSWSLYDRLEGEGAAQLVLLALMRHAGKEGECWPSVETLCRLTGKSDRYVRDAINRLVELKIVEKTRRDVGGMKSVNNYRICQNIPDSQSGSMYRTSGSMYRDVRQIVPVSPAVCTDELDTSELEPRELEKPPIVPQGTPKPSSKRGPDYDASFLTFWAAYMPNDLNSRSKKPEAAKVWASLSADEQAAAMDAIPAFAAGSDWQRGFVPGAQVWLRSRKWEYPPRPVAANGTTVAVDWNDPVQVESYRRRIEQENLRRIHG